MGDWGVFEARNARENTLRQDPLKWKWDKLGISMFIIYDLIFLVFALLWLPVYLCKRKFHQGFRMRLGILPEDLELNQPIWLHAVSVGEVMATRKVIAELRVTYPDKKFLVSTVTPTGNKIAKGIARPSDFVSYLPLDLSFIVRYVVDRIKPSLFVIMETEIWPNLISYLYRKNIPIILVNGRISNRSFGGYRIIKFLFKPLLNKINLFCVQTKVDAERFLRLGVPQEKIKITGNMKFDIADLKKDYTDYRLKLGLDAQERLLVAGSTHPGEEEVILSIYKELLRDFPDLQLLIAPRHPERASEIASLVTKFGFVTGRISLLDTQTLPHSHTQRVFILDSVGELFSFYALADIVFVGGSLVKKGGHNILEPASLGKPVIFGPHMFNFRDIASLFLENEAALLVHTKEELERNIRDLLNNSSRVTGLGQRAKALVLENQGATRRNLEYIRNYLSVRGG